MRRLAEDEPDPRRRCGPPVGLGIVAEGRPGRAARTGATTAVAVPSPRLRRSSPRRAWIGPDVPPSSRWMKPRTSRKASSKASHGLRSRNWVAVWRPDVARRDAQRRGPARAGRRAGWPAGWRGGRRAGGRPGRARRAGRPRSVRGSRRDRRAGGGCAGRAARRPGSRRRGPPGSRSSRVARIASAPTSAVARRRSSASSGAWRCSDPPRWSRQTVQR